MTTALATKPDAIDASLIERVLIHGDLRQLTPAQKVSYYKSVCESVGLNPLTQPFQYLVLNGKEILYATRAATEQLRQVHAVSVQIMAREVVEDCYVVTARAILATGRQDENIGAVPIANLKGEARANAMMKAETKAKRRVTLAICGLGMLDETEVASIPGGPNGYTVQAPTTTPAPLSAGPSVGDASTPNAGDSDSRPVRAESLGDADLSSGSIADGALRVARVEVRDTKNPNVKKYIVVLSDGRELSTINPALGTLAQNCCQDGDPVSVETKTSRWGEDLTSLHRVERVIQLDHGTPIDASEIPF